MDVYLDEATQELLGGTSDDTAIKSQVRDIGFQVVGLMQSCRASCDFVVMPNHAADPITFDLSQKADREQTRRTLEWPRRMEANVREPADVRYVALLTLLD